MKWMMIVLMVSICTAFFSSSAHGQLRPPEFSDKESATEKVVFIDSGKTLFDYQWNLTKTDQGGKTIVKVEAKGTWYGTEEPVPWQEESVMEITQNGVRTLSWKKDSEGAEQESWTMTYNWSARTVESFWKDRKSGKTKTKTIKMKEDALAGDSMFFALRGFPFEKGAGTEYTGQIIDSSGMVYTGSIIHHGEERLKTAFGEIDTFKLELKPKGLVGVVSPKMYIWYTKAAPHIQVQFEGRDAGLTQPRTTKKLISYQPEAAIK